MEFGVFWGSRKFECLREGPTLSQPVVDQSAANTEAVFGVLVGAKDVSLPIMLNVDSFRFASALFAMDDA